MFTKSSINLNLKYKKVVKVTYCNIVKVLNNVKFNKTKKIVYKKN